MIVLSWNEISHTVIMNAFKRLYSSFEEIELNFQIDQFDNEDNIPRSTLFRNIINEKIENRY